jgi:hypothetical protein
VEAALEAKNKSNATLPASTTRHDVLPIQRLASSGAILRWRAAQSRHFSGLDTRDAIERIKLKRAPLGRAWLRNVFPVRSRKDAQAKRRSFQRRPARPSGACLQRSSFSHPVHRRVIYLRLRAEGCRRQQQRHADFPCSCQSLTPPSWLPRQCSTLPGRRAYGPHLASASEGVQAGNVSQAADAGRYPAGLPKPLKSRRARTVRYQQAICPLGLRILDICWTRSAWGRLTR